jgi:lincosamide nucleotidyltransferase A/C/D/E
MMTDVLNDEGMSLSDVIAVLAAVRSVGCRFWLEGGWGVDALVGHQTRPHRDVDLDFDAEFETDLLEVLAGLGYAVETDWRPNRVELVAARGRWVDLHPLVIDANGDARQAALDGGWHEFDKSWFTTGSLGGVPVPCMSVEAQRLFHSGYERREVDLLDLSVLERLDE